LSKEVLAVKLTFASIPGVICLCFLSGSCGGGAKPTQVMPPTLQFTLPAASPQIDAGQSVTLKVNEPVTWSLEDNTGRAIATGLSNQTTTSAVYTAPAATSVTSTLQLSVVATLVTDPTQSAAMAIMVNPYPTISGNLSAQSPRRTSCQFNPVQTGGIADGNAGSTYPLKYGPNPSGGTPPYTWSIISGAAPAGLVVDQNTTGSPYLYGTPVGPGCSLVTLELTDSTGATVTSPVYYVIIAPAPLKISAPNYTDAYTGTPYPPTAISVSGGQPPYGNWTASDLPPGMVLTQLAQNSSAAVLSGTPNGTPQQTYTSNVTVYDSQSPYPAMGSTQLNMYQWLALPTNACDPAQNGGIGGTINTANGSLQGSYAFLMRGFDASGPVVMAGSFAADGAGNVTGGVADVMRASGSQTGVAVTGGSYSVLEQNGSGVAIYEQSGCLALTTSTGTTTAFAISMGGCSTSPDPGSGTCLADASGNPGVFTTGRLIEFDDNTGSGTRGSGFLRWQDNSAFAAGLNGFYAFGLRGWDSTNLRYAEAGSFTASSGTLSAVAADINDGGTMQSTLTAGTGTAGAIDMTTGRATGTLAVGTPALNNLAFYVVSAQEVIVAGTGTPSASNPFVSGEAILTAGPFGLSSLENTHIFHTSGLATGGPDPNVGILQFDGLGTVTGTQYENQAGTLSTTSLSANYTVDANSGRILFYAPSNTQTLGDHPYVGYVLPASATLGRQDCVKLSNCITGFLLSTDASAQAGELDFQTSILPPPPPFSSLYVTGYYFYGTDEMMDASSSAISGAANANPTGSKYSGIQSASYPSPSYCQQPACAVLVPNETLSTGGVYTVNANGSGSMGGETVSVTNGNLIFYLDESPLNLHPTLTVVEQ
jgi:hypothetical protein